MESSTCWAAREGSPIPLGATFLPTSQTFNFALYSKHATSVTLLLYGEGDCFNPIYRHHYDPLINKSGRVWHCRLPAALVEGARYYAYQIDGPREVTAGHRFDPGKVLLDPYARAVHFPAELSRYAACRPGANPGQAPLGLLQPGTSDFDWTGDRRPIHGHDTVVYELHVRGFTMRPSSGISLEKRGTFAGLIEKIPYLKELGITAVELMPVFQGDPQEGNYWGYMPLSYFALNQAYASRRALGAEIDEFKSLVKALHQADIEVIIDVVYNHTVEGNEFGPTYSFRGIDNTTYYLLEHDRARYRNDSGTGNVLHTANRYVRSMVLDSLRYWAREMHVDGFRFDLASLFTRHSDSSINLDDPPIIEAIQSDPDLSHVRLIAEAWDLSSYQLGRTFPGHSWLQWNGKFRDEVRSFVRGDPGQVSNLMRRLYGSDDLFPDTLADAYHAFQTVNFITNHDGFCLYDLLSYSRKRNAANGHDNSDGSDQNHSWNCGWEGEDGVPPEILTLRQRQAKNLFCLLMFANGTPHFLAGDEFLNTQGGNNNPYNQDNETTWLDWDRLERHREFFRFCKLVIAFRKAHPSLGRSRFWRDDVRWYGPLGDVSPSSQQLAVYLRGESQGDQDIYLMINAGPEDVAFEIREGAASGWCRAVDTGHPSPEDICAPGAEEQLQARTYPLKARSVVVLIRSRCPGTRSATESRSAGA